MTQWHFRTVGEEVAFQYVVLDQWQSPSGRHKFVPNLTPYTKIDSVRSADLSVKDSFLEKKA